MPRASRGGAERFQVNVSLDDEHWHIALLQLAIREGKSVPELLRPQIVAYLRRQLKADPSLASAVASLEVSRSAARDRARRRRGLAAVTALPADKNQRLSRKPSDPSRRTRP